MEDMGNCDFKSFLLLFFVSYICIMPTETVHLDNDPYIVYKISSNYICHHFLLMAKIFLEIKNSMKKYAVCVASLAQ